MIQKLCDMHIIKLSKYKKSNIINRKGKEKPIITSTWKENSKQISEKCMYFFKSFLRKTLVTRDSPQTQKSVVKSLNTSASTINKIISQDLQC